jgi:hypothetical protein
LEVAFYFLILFDTLLILKVVAVYFCVSHHSADGIQ